MTITYLLTIMGNLVLWVAFASQLEIPSEFVILTPSTALGAPNVWHLGISQCLILLKYQVVNSHFEPHGYKYNEPTNHDKSFIFIV